MPIPETPYTRKESYLNAIATGDSSGIPNTPYTREEMYLDAIAKGGGGGGGGSSTLSGLTDVDISNPADGQTLVYDAASSKWVNGSGGGGGLTVLQGTFDDEQEQITLEVTCSELYSMCQNGVVGVQYEQHTEYEPGDEEDITVTTLISRASVAVGTITGTTYGFVLGESNTGGEANDIVVFTSMK